MNWKKFFQSKTTGCLEGKTPEQRSEFFYSLSGFAKTDPQFFKNQYLDLRRDERLEFHNWIKKRKKNHQLITPLVAVLWSLLEEMERNKA